MNAKQKRDRKINILARKLNKVEKEYFSLRTQYINALAAAQRADFVKKNYPVSSVRL